jgi:hypothetical protein
MYRFQRRCGRIWVFNGAGLGLSLMLTACAAPGDSHPVHKVAEFAGIATKAPQTQSFVADSRPAATDYMPVGVTPPKRALATRTPEEVKKLQDEMDATLRANQAKANDAKASQAVTN